MTDESTDLSKFRQLCSVTLLVDEQGQNPILCASVNWNGTEHKRCIQLAPVIHALADKIRSIHDNLHSQAIAGEFIGAGNREYSGKKRKNRTRTPSRGHSRRSVQVDDTSQEFYPEEYTNPDDYQLAMQQYQQTAQQGYQNPYAPPSYQPQGLSSPSPYGPTLDDLRSQSSTASRNWSQPYNPYGFTDVTGRGTNLLQVQGWSDSIKKMARELSESKAVKNLFHDLRNAAEDKNVQKALLTSTLGPEAGPLLDSAYKVHDIVVEARKGCPVAQTKLQNLKEAADSGNKAAELSLNAAQNINDKLKDKESGLEDESGHTIKTSEAETNSTEESTDFVQGWLYNRPYRTNAQIVTAPMRGEFPSVGLFLRDAWHEGLEFAGSMKRRPLFKLGA